MDQENFSINGNPGSKTDDILAQVLKDLAPYLTKDQTEQAYTCRDMDELALFAASEHLELPGEITGYISAGVITGTSRKRGQTVNPGLERLLAMLRSEHH